MSTDLLKALSEGRDQDLHRDISPSDRPLPPPERVPQLSQLAPLGNRRD
jgi:hypothetical protein